METGETPYILELPVPDTCPSCNIVWETGSCPRCGLTQSDVAGLLASAIADYGHARAAVLAGDLPLARLHLAAVRNCGISALAEHSAVLRLAVLCGQIIGSAPPSETPPAIPSNGKDTSLPPWLVPLTVGGGVFGLAAFCVAMVALVLAIVALVLAIIVFLRH